MSSVQFDIVDILDDVVWKFESRMKMKRNGRRDEGQRQKQQQQQKNNSNIADYPDTLTLTLRSSIKLCPDFVSHSNTHAHMPDLLYQWQ